VWNLSEVNGRLLMGHHDGFFEINNDGASIIDPSSGFWTFLPFYDSLPSPVIIAGTYQGINFYDYKAGVFKDKRIVAHFESARFVCRDKDNNIWISHPYKGIYRVRLNGNTPETKQYSVKEGVFSPAGNYVFSVKNRIIMTTENGIFEYNENKDRFEPSAFYNDLFKDKKLRYLKEDRSGNVWFVFGETLGVIDMSAAKPQVIYFPELSDKFVSGYEFIFPLNKNNIFIGGDRGFYHINYEQYKSIKYPLQVQVSSVKCFNRRDTVLFGGYTGQVNEEGDLTRQKKAEVEHSWNSFHFEFSSPVYAQQSNIDYSYFLEGFDKNWSEFSKKTQKEYTNLPAGDYQFKVKARNNLGDESAIGVYHFSVLPPWYQSYWAWAFYIFLFVCINYLLFVYLKRRFKIQQQRHEAEQKHLLNLHQLELEKTEKELVKLRNDKLESEIQHKNTELASVAMHLVQKAELLGKIKDEMVRLKKQPDNEKGPAELNKIIRVINEEDKIDEQWEQFTSHFDNVHSGFLAALKAKYPNISPNELKLSAYLRMNLSSKEIAQLMNISVRGVEVSRYRLRKKLQIPTETSLYEFLLKQ
jgi:DNA-binding CsgD family transcriptional regulator